MPRRKDPNRYPKGWNRAKVQALLEYYENQSDGEAIAEAETAAKPRRRRTVGYRREDASGTTTLVPVAGLPIGRLPRCSNEASPEERQ